MATRHLIVVPFTFIFATGCFVRPEEHLRAQPVAFMDLTQGKDEGRRVTVPLAPIPTKAPAPPQPATAKPATAVAQKSASGPTLLASFTPMAATPDLDVPPANAPQPDLVTPAGPDDRLEIRCVRTPEMKLSATRQSGPNSREQCLYVGVDWQDILRLPVRNKDERNRAISFLENLSETNCSVFTTRLLGNKATLDATRGSLRELATATSAGTAVVAPAISATVGLLNMVGGTSLDNVSSAFYADKTAQAINAAITAERARTQKILLDNRSKELSDYTYFQALKEWQSFDHACSMESGLEQLVAIANAAAKAQVDDANSPHSEMVRQLKEQLEDEKTQHKRATELLAQATERAVAEKGAAEQQRLKEVMTELQSQVTTSNKQIDDLGKKIQSLTEQKQPAAPPANGGTKPQ